ncbi:MAG: sensor histidine kinase [Bacillota bacterium]
MGFSIALHARQSSSLRLSSYLLLLAGFGILHGISEWIYVYFSPGFAAGGWKIYTGTVISSGHAILAAISFTFLFSFGMALIVNTLGWQRWLKWLPFLFLGVWIWIFIFKTPVKTGAESEWLRYAEIASRYFLALPGAILSSIGLYLQRGEVRGLYYPALERLLMGASAVFAIYALVGGLVVPYAGFFPASIINADVLLELGLPVQLLRAGTGVFIAYFVIRSLDLYEIENRKHLKYLREREIIWLEKDRIRRDLHDGVIQAIYGLSLRLDQALKLLKKDQAASEVLLNELKGRADIIISQLRGYLQELKPSPGLPGKAVIIVEDLLADFTASTGFIPFFRCWGHQEKNMTAEQASHFYHIASEILSNIRRHAGAGKVEVNLNLGHRGVSLLVRDNGVGFIPVKIAPQGMGLDNIRVRAALGGGWVNVDSVPGQGTEVTFWLPYEANEGRESLGR